MAVLGSLLLDSLAAAFLLLVFAYIYGTWTYDYFKKRGIPYVKPWPFVGNYGPALLGLTTMSWSSTPIYNELKKHRFGGMFVSREPAVLLCDPELVRLVFTKDFASLNDHGMVFDEEQDPLSLNLFNLSGRRWKNLRAKLSPIFTSGKLKHMLPLMVGCSDVMCDYLRKQIASNQIIEMKEPLMKFSTDVIGTCAFGIDCNTFKDPNSLFYQASLQFFSPSLLTTLRFLVFYNSKLIMKLLPFKWLFPKHHEFFINVMRDSIEYRVKNNVERNDFVQMLMELQKNDEHKTKESHPDEVIMTTSTIAAQAFFFFVAGQDAIASSVGFNLYHLALNPRIQEDLADEIHSVLSHHDQTITYEGLKEMKLLNMVVSEIFRMYPPGGTLMRKVTAPSYTLAGTDFTMEKGMNIQVPVHGFHSDPDIYPEPEVFDPYRFTDEAISKRHPFAYLPFGEGPRICIANRFAILETKLALATLIRDFKFSVCSQTQIPAKLKTHTFSLTPTKGFILKVEERKV